MNSNFPKFGDGNYKSSITEIGFIEQSCYLFLLEANYVCLAFAYQIKILVSRLYIQCAVEEIKHFYNKN